MTLLMHLMLQHRANAQAILLHTCSVKPNRSKRSTESGLDRDGLRALAWAPRPSTANTAAWRRGGGGRKLAARRMPWITYRHSKNAGHSWRRLE